MRADDPRGRGTEGAGCGPHTQFTTFNGRWIAQKCDDASASVRCQAFVQAGDGKTVALLVKRSPDSAEALGRLTTDIAHVLLNQKAVTS